MTVTVGIPFSNEPLHLLEQSIRSVFAQSNRDWTLLLVSDGAPAGSNARVGEIRDPRVRLIKHADSRGLAVRLNEIASVCETDLLFRMDGDDIMHPDRLAIQARAFEEHPDADVIGTQAFVIDEHTALRGLFPFTEAPSTGTANLKRSAFIHPSVAARTTWFLAHPYDEAMARAQDRALWLSTSQHSSFRKLGDELLFYRINSQLSYSRYALSSQFDRIAIRRHGPALVGRAGTARQLLLSYAKQARYRIRMPGASTQALYSRRFAPLRPERAVDVTETLSAASQHPVPGWADVTAPRPVT